MNPLFVSCHTPDELYTAATARLKVSLAKYDLENDIHTFQPLGTWRENTCYKPFFLKSMLDKHRGRPLVWVDADAEIVAYPELLFNLTTDIGAGFKNNELLSGTLYLDNNQQVRNLIRLWLVELQQPDTHPNILGKEQQALSRALEHLLREGLILFEQLPFSYVAIFDTPHQESPVILHHQLSREGRDLYGF